MRLHRTMAATKAAPDPSRAAWPRWIPLLLAGVTLVLYLPVWGHDFVRYDDDLYVTANPLVQQGVTWEGIREVFWQTHGRSTYWHPVTWLSHMLDCQLFGLQPGWHHLVNVFLHALNGVLLFGLLRRVTGAVWSSAMVAGLFLWHPLQVDTVAWVAERKNLLATLFFLLTLHLYVRYVGRPTAGRYVAMASTFALGLMCKPMIVTLPCVLWLLDYWPLGRLRFGGKLSWLNPAMPGPARSPASRSPTSMKRVILEKVPLLVLSALSSWMTILGHRQLEAGREVLRYSLGVRMENAVVSYATYLRRLVWPDDLAVIYPHQGGWPVESVAVSVVLLLAISAWAWWAGKRQPALRVGWAWFLGMLVPTIGLVQVGVQAMADRFVYLPLVGVLWMGVWWVVEVWAASARPAARKRMAWAAGGWAVAAAACLVLTTLQLATWKNSITLFERALNVTTRNEVAHQNLALEYYLAKRMDEALLHARAALEISPGRAEPNGLVGVILDAKGRTAEAVPYLRESARLQPGLPAAWRRLGMALARTSRPAEAIDPLQRALAGLPGDVEARATLAMCRVQTGKPVEAVSEYRLALQHQPAQVEVLNNLAWLLATHPREEVRHGTEAVRLAEEACRLTDRRHPQLLGTLAAALAEAGRFDEAVATAQTAIQLAEEAGQAEVAAANRALVQTYQAGMAHREGE